MELSLPETFEAYSDARKAGFLKVKTAKEGGRRVAGTFCTFTPLEILDAAGKELYTVTDSGAVAEIDALINKAGGENADHGNAEGDPLYTYVYWQETTLHAGEDPDTEREYLEVFRTQVRQGSNAVTTEVLSDTLEGVGSFVGVEGLGGLLTFTAEVPRETADALRDPAQFAGA